MLDYFAWKPLIAELAGLAELEESADETSKERAAQLRRQLILPKGLDVNAPGHAVDSEGLCTKLTDYRMHSGSRNFVDLPQTHLWYSVRDHVSKLAGAELTGFVTDGVTEGWIDFSFCGHAFTINDQFGDYLFFVKDSTCPDSILMDVSAHFAVLLGLADG